MGGGLALVFPCLASGEQQQQSLGARVHPVSLAVAVAGCSRIRCAACRRIALSIRHGRLFIHPRFAFVVPSPFDASR